MLVKQPLFWVIVVAAVATSLWYRASVYREPPVPQNPKVVFVTGGSGPYWEGTIQGAKAAAKDLQVELQVERPTDAESLEQQLAILSGLDGSKCDGIAISPVDAEAQTSVINRLASETKVVTFDSDAPLSERQAYIGTSNYAAGMLCAQLVEEALPEGGKVAVLLANLTKDNLVDRKLGFAEALGRGDDDAETLEEDPAVDRPAPHLEVVGYLIDDGRNAKCEQLIRDTLTQHPDLACFVGMNARHGPILLKVLGEEGKLGAIKLITFDEAAETLDGIEQGFVHATVAQDPYQYGYEAVRMLASLSRNAGRSIPIVGKGSLHVPTEAIHKEQLSTFRARLGQRQSDSAAASADSGV